MSEKNITNVLNFAFKTNEEEMEFIEQLSPKNILLNDDQTLTESFLNLSSDDNSKTFTQKYIMLEPGSIRGSIFTMTSIALGMGCLTLPFQFQTLSFSLSVIIMTLAALASYWSLNIMILSGQKHNKTNYSKLVRLVFGHKFATLFDYIMILYIFGILIAYQVLSNNNIKIVFDLLGSFIYSCFIALEDFSKYSDFKLNILERYYVLYPIMFSISIFILIPLCLIKDISKMRFISLFCVLTLLYT